jgi:hypothetical protein
MSKSNARSPVPPPMKTETKPKQPPEKKIGPFAGGIGVCIWLNRIETDQGPRYVRSITVNPRRYYDRETDQWKNAAGYNQSDLPALLFALNKAQEYCYEEPLPGEAASDSPGENGAHSNKEELPF